MPDHALRHPRLGQGRSARRPLRCEPAIPAAAAKRQPLFLFGTLMDADVLACVLGQGIDGMHLMPAELDGFRREAARGVSYPVLVPDAGARVAGRLLLSATSRDIARINHYESDEYRAELHPVHVGGMQRAAWLYVGCEGAIAPAGRSWELEDWAAHHKDRLLAACPGWMAGCGDRDG